MGKDGKKVAAMLVKAIEEGMPLLEAAEMGRRIKDYLDAESGNYKRPTTEGGKKLIAIQKNFIFLTSITSLWKATVSSLPELALMTRSLFISSLTLLRCVGDIFIPKFLNFSLDSITSLV